MTEKSGSCAVDLEELAWRHVVRIADNYTVDEDPRMRLEHIHDHFTAEAVKIVQAHKELRVPRQGSGVFRECPYSS